MPLASIGSSACSAAQLGSAVHWPPLHAPVAQGMSQSPQCCGSSITSTQRSPQRVAPPAQVSPQPPSEQTSPSAQTVSQPPQCIGSFCTSMHTPLQLSCPSAQETPPPPPPSPGCGRASPWMQAPPAAPATKSAATSVRRNIILSPAYGRGESSIKQ